MRDKRTWAQTHLRFAPIFLVNALLFFVAGVYLSASFFLPGITESANYVVLVATGLAVLVCVGGGIMATRFARGLEMKAG